MTTKLVCYLIWLFLLHYIGDFIAQTRYIANNKGSNIFVLMVHVCIYTYILGMGTFPFSTGGSFGNFLIANMILHFLTDLCTSKFTKYFHNQKNEYGFFSVIGFDQFLHAVALLSTCSMIFKDLK